ncbi:double-stranded RNA binding motif domain-containing protein [Myxococcus sp. Y35]|uniref:double-stranded RNA binding motif domain-containing protein n=1 Tax=Pseudomyxococcus flavus TaxID=3115648 RepID=UPI003CE6C606
MSGLPHFTSTTMRGPLGHVVTLRARDVQVEAHAPTQQAAEEDAALALTRELRRQDMAKARSVHRTLSRRRP